MFLQEELQKSRDWLCCVSTLIIISVTLELSIEHRNRNKGFYLLSNMILRLQHDMIFL